MNKKHDLFKELNINAPDTISNNVLDINISNIKSKVNAQITSVSPERKVFTMNFKKRISLIAAAAVLTLGVTVFASSGIRAIWFGSSSANAQYHSLPTSKRVVKDIGYDAVLINTFENGYTFKNGTIVNNELQAEDGSAIEKFKSLSISYEKNNDEVIFSQKKYSSKLAVEGTVVSTINNTDLYYRTYIYKLVPNDYVLTAEEEKAQENGTLVFGYGSSDIEISKMQHLTWVKDGILYQFMQSDGNLSMNELMDMAKECIEQ